MLPLINLMNEQFRDGKFSEAQNINCHLKVIEQLNNIKHLIKLRIFELTPSSNCTRFCLNVENLNTSLVCSNKQQLYTPFDDLNAEKDWHFNITVNNSENCVSEVRFWIGLEVNGAEIRYLDCMTSEPDMPELFTKPSANERFTTQIPERDAWSGSPKISVSTKIAIALGTLLLLAVMAFLSVIFRKEKFCCNGKPSDENVPAPDGDHDYTYIDLDFIASVSRGRNSVRSNPTNLGGRAPLSQSMGHLLESRNLDCELPPIPRRGHSIESLPVTMRDFLPLHPILPNVSSLMSARELPPIPREDQEDDPSSQHKGQLHTVLIHRAITNKEDIQTVEDCTNDNEYLHSRETLCNIDLPCNEKEQSPVLSNEETSRRNVEGIEEPEEIDALNQENDENESEDATSGSFTENEYAGLSQETLNDSDSSRSSTGILYTLLHGIQRAEGSVEGRSDLSGDKDDIQPGQDSTDTDEHGYLILFPNDVPLPLGNREIQPCVLQEANNIEVKANGNKHAEEGVLLPDNARAGPGNEEIEEDVADITEQGATAANNSCEVPPEQHEESLAESNAGGSTFAKWDEII